MAILQGWQEKSMTYLVQAMADWKIAVALVNMEIVQGKGDRSGTIVAPIVYLLDLEGYPDYDERGLLIVGHRIKLKYAEVQLSDATAQLSKTVDSIIDFLHQCVDYVDPIIGGSPPPWMAIQHSEPDYVGIHDPKQGYLSNQVNIDVRFRVPFCHRSCDYPKDEIFAT